MKPLAHQKKILAESWEQPAWAFFMEMGTGKTKVAIDTAGLWHQHKGLDGFIAIAKKGEYANWHLNELPTHMSPDIRWKSFLYDSKFSSRKKKDEFELFLKFPGLKVLVINIESLTFPNAQRAIESLIRVCRSYGIFVDESTCIKHHDGKRAKVVYGYAKGAKLRRIMTGTPWAEGPLDLWGQVWVLGSKLLEHRSYYSFRGEYAYLKDVYLGQRVIKQIDQSRGDNGFKNLDKLQKIIATFSHEQDLASCVDMPPQIYEKIAVPMTEVQQKHYSELAKFAMTTLEDGEEMELDNALALLTKLHQVACGQIKKADGSYISLENHKIQAVVDLASDFPGKGIIWANYQQNIRDIYEALLSEFGPAQVAHYYGPTSEADRISALARFKDKDDPLRWIVGNQRSLAYGNTLVTGTLNIYYSNGFSLEQRLQSEFRTWRIGQKEKVRYVDIYCPGTVDEKVMMALRDKKEVSDIIKGTGIRSWI